MRTYSRDDPELKQFSDQIARHTRQSEVLGMDYWVFVEGSNPVGVVSLGKEPIQLIEPPGTPVAVLSVVDPDKPRRTIREFAEGALAKSRERSVEYALAIINHRYSEPISLFKELGFQELDDAYRMTCSLEGAFEPSDVLQFRRIERGEMRRFIELAVEFLSGSADVMLGKALKNFLGVPEGFLDFYYNTEEFYFAKAVREIVGIININPKEGLISNIGVDPSKRGRGYGTQIMLFGLNTLKDRGCEKARLRVHVDNTPAVRLYEKLGFEKTDRYSTLIWREQEK
ncbi:MAG: GNAT family N-acetyltransferase [Candidatus Bathyarchaeia archaeon]